MKMQIEKAQYDVFIKKFNEGDYKCLRYGQAFYNHFNLHKLVNQDALCNLYEKDGEFAVKCIHNVFEFI